MTFTRRTTTVASLALFVAGIAGAQQAQPSAPLAYPAARRGNFVDHYHGVRVADPYRWMEELDSPETRAWVESEAALTESYLAAIPAREAIRKRLTELWNYERYTVPFVRSGTDVLHPQHRPAGAERPLLRGLPRRRAAGAPRPQHALRGRDRGALGHLGLRRREAARLRTSAAGSDWQEWRVRDVATGADAGDRLEWTKFTRAAWTHDGTGLLLRPLRPAAGGRRAKGRQLLPEALLPPARDAAVRRRDRLPARRPQGLAVLPRRHRRRPLPRHPRRDRHHPVQRRLRPRPDRPGRKGRRTPRRLRRRVTRSSATTAPSSTSAPTRTRRTVASWPSTRRNPSRTRWREVVPRRKDVLVRVSLVDDTFIATT